MKTRGSQAVRVWAVGHLQLAEVALADVGDFVRERRGMESG